MKPTPGYLTRSSGGAFGYGRAAPREKSPLDLRRNSSRYMAFLNPRGPKANFRMWQAQAAFIQDPNRFVSLTVTQRDGTKRSGFAEVQDDGMVLVCDDLFGDRPSIIDAAYRAGPFLSHDGPNIYEELGLTQWKD